MNTLIMKCCSAMDDLEDIMLNETSPRTLVRCDLPYMWNAKMSNTWKQRVDGGYQG
jgi:hypothetical protein